MARPKCAVANPAATDKATATSTTPASSEEAAKRPARGFHRFRNGLINVTPKGRELELVHQNQQSTLLSLPPEIRSRIWKFVLGGHIIPVPYWGLKKPHGFNHSTQDNGLLYPYKLLQVCRQIYSEAAQLYYQMNTFDFRSWCPRNFYRRFWPYQRGAITSIRIGGFSDAEMMIRVVELFANLNHLAFYSFGYFGRQTGLSDRDAEQFIRDRVKLCIRKKRFESLHIEFED